jgi:hypothetical protein
MNQAGYGRFIAQQNRDRKAERARRADPLRQTGRIETPMGRLMDLARIALPPGKRISKTGHRYYERRENRSDRPPGRL